MKPLPRALIAAAVLVASVRLLTGQIVLTGSSYVQDFNNLGSGLPDGWTVYSSSTDTALGTVAAFTAAPTTWASVTSDTSFRNISSDTLATGSNATTQAANPDRAIGFRPQNAATRDGSVVLEIADTLGFAGFSLGVDLFTANNAGSTNQTYNIEFRIGSSGPFSLLGTYATVSPFGSFSFTTGGATLASLDNQSQPIQFRIHNSGGGSDSSYDTLGIDNVALGYSAIPEPSTHAAVVAALALGGAAWCRRRRLLSYLEASAQSSEHQPVRPPWRES